MFGDLHLQKNEKEEGKHPTQKPLQLLDYILRSSSNTGDLVLDPFCGSGTTGVASIINNRKFVGIEKKNIVNYLLEDLKKLLIFNKKFNLLRYK